VQVRVSLDNRLISTVTCEKNVGKEFARDMEIRNYADMEVPLVCKFLLVLTRTISMDTNVEQIRSLRGSLRMKSVFMVPQIEF